MPIFLLIRHAENDYVKEGRLAGRKNGVMLNEKGKKQAVILAQHIKKQPIHAIYSSPLERAIETATPLAELLHLPVIPSDPLIEIDFGEWEGQLLKTLRHLKEWKKVQNTPSLMCFPSGESFLEAQMRISQWMLTVCESLWEKEMVACFSHSDLIKLATAFFIGLSLDHFQRLVVSPASVTTLFITAKSSHLLGLNEQIS